MTYNVFGGTLNNTLLLFVVFFKTQTKEDVESVLSSVDLLSGLICQFTIPLIGSA